jgi:molecular chaperone GrpE (heat shock protein)
MSGRTAQRPRTAAARRTALLLTLLLAAVPAWQSAATAADEGTSPPTQTLAQQMQPKEGVAYVAYYAYVKHRKPDKTELAPCPEIPVGGSPAAGEYLMQIVLVPSADEFTKTPYAALKTHWGAIRAGLTYVEKDGTTKIQQRDPMVEPVADSLSNWNLKLGPDENIWGRDAKDAHNLQSHALPFLMPLVTKVGGGSVDDSKEAQEVALLRALCGENGIKVVDQANVGEVELYRLHRLLEAEGDQITALNALPWLRVFLDPGADPAAEAPDLGGLLALTQKDGGFVRSKYLKEAPSAAHALLFQEFRREAQAKVTNPPAEPVPMPSEKEQEDIVAAAAESACTGLAGTDKFEDCWKTTVAPGVWSKRESAGCNDKPDPKACLTAWAATAAATEFAAYRAAPEAAKEAASKEQGDDEAQGRPRRASTMWLLPIALALLALLVWRLDQRRTAAERKPRTADPDGHLDPGSADRARRSWRSVVIDWLDRKDEEGAENPAARGAYKRAQTDPPGAAGSPAGAGGGTPFDGIAGDTAPASEQATRLDGLERQITHVAEELAKLSARLDRLRDETFSAKPGAASDAAFEAAVAAAVKRETETLRSEFDSTADDLRTAINQTKQEAKQWTGIQKRVNVLDRLSQTLGEYVQKLNERLKHVESKSPSGGSAPRAPTKPEFDDPLHTRDDPLAHANRDTAPAPDAHPSNAPRADSQPPPSTPPAQQHGNADADSIARERLKSKLETLDVFSERGWDRLWAGFDKARPQDFLDDLVTSYLPENLGERVYEVVDDWLAETFDGRASLIRPRPGASLLHAEHRSISTVPRDKGAFNVVSSLVRAGVKYDGQVVREAVVIRVA